MEHLITILVTEDCPEYHCGRLTHWNRHRTSCRLEATGLVFEEDGALWLRTTAHGDDRDRVLRKSDDTYTYFVPDIAYHIDKHERGFDAVIDVWGADHHGYVPRMKAAMAALVKLIADKFDEGE